MHLHSFRLETDPSSPEILNLLLEEALFLSYGLGCLYIFDVHGQKILSCSEFWTICLECDPRFLQRYVAYHHFRSKGWVVKSGLKFGGDFCKLWFEYFFLLCYNILSVRVMLSKPGKLYSVVQRWSRCVSCILCCESRGCIWKKCNWDWGTCSKKYELDNSDGSQQTSRDIREGMLFPSVNLSQSIL